MQYSSLPKSFTFLQRIWFKVFDTETIDLVEDRSLMRHLQYCFLYAKKACLIIPDNFVFVIKFSSNEQKKPVTIVYYCNIMNIEMNKSILITPTVLELEVGHSPFIYMS